MLLVITEGVCVLSVSLLYGGVLISPVLFCFVLFCFGRRHDGVSKNFDALLIRLRIQQRNKHHLVVFVMAGIFVVLVVLRRVKSSC